jgi:redox-sensitive bicupin YhaK (pirin superfamily)
MSIRLILGELFQETSPVKTLSNPVYAECRLAKGAELKLPETFEERSIYVLSGSLRIGNEEFGSGQMVVFEIGKEAVIKAAEDSFFMIIGGDRLEKKRFMWWNFVSSSEDRIETAREDWREGRFEMIPGEDEFVPLPKY